MADYIVTSGELTTVANAIREKNGTSSNLSWPDGFVSGISSGGGGSSDFSMAEVTVVNNSQSDAFDFIMTVIRTNGGISATTGIVLGTPVGETEVFNVVLYKGNAHIQFEVSGKLAHLVITTSGNITDLGADNYMVTGDCTITIS